MSRRVVREVEEPVVVERRSPVWTVLGLVLLVVVILVVVALVRNHDNGTPVTTPKVTVPSVKIEKNQ